MKKISIILGLLTVTVVMISCSDIKRTPGKVYMPDMAYSRAVETYSDHSYLNAEGINYNARPVAGTVSRNGEVIYEMLKDTTGAYALAYNLVNPLAAMDSTQTVEAERLYLINCGICHGTKLDGNGPLYKGGEGPYPAKPATLVGDAKIEALPAGVIFHVITYGKNLMGSYASQVSPKQRWMIAGYVKSKQTAAHAGETAAPATSAAKDSTVKK